MPESPLITGRRALALVEQVSGNPVGLSFSELAVVLGLAPASLSRLLKVLADEDWIRQDLRSGRYEVGYRTLGLGNALRDYGMHSRLVEGLVNELALNVGHSTCIAEFQGDCFVLVAKSEVRSSYHFIDLFAPNTDWIDNGMGQVLLAFQPREVVTRVYHDNFDVAVPEGHWTRFEMIRANRALIRVEGVVTRVIVVIEPGPDTRVRHVIAVAALTSETLDIADTVAKVTRAASEAARRLSVLSDARLSTDAA